MEDIAPVLWGKLQNEYLNNKQNDKRVQRFYSKLKEGTAVSEDAAKLSEYLGEAAAKAMKKVLDLKNLPNGKLYYNIANRTVRPLLTMMYEDVNEAGIAVLNLENEKKGIGIKASKGEFPEDRVRGFINKLVDLSMMED